MEHKPRVCVDFDGVLNDYTGWKGEDDLGLPAIGAAAFLRRLHGPYEVVIFTTRPEQKVWDWLDKHNLFLDVDAVTSTKPPAFAYVDDRAICHRGDFGETLAILNDFKTHWEPSPEPEDA